MVEETAGVAERVRLGDLRRRKLRARSEEAQAMAISRKARPKFGGSVVLNRPTLATLMGAICCEWSFTEQMLANVFASLVGWQVLSGDVAAIEAFESIPGFAQKVATLNVVIENRLGDPLKTELKALLKSVDDLRPHRNNIIHGRWALSDDHPDCLIWNKRTTGDMHGTAEVYSEARFRDILDRIVKTRTAFMTVAAVKLTPLLDPPSARGPASQAPKVPVRRPRARPPSG